RILLLGLAVIVRVPGVDLPLVVQRIARVKSIETGGTFPQAEAAGVVVIVLVAPFLDVELDREILARRPVERGAYLVAITIGNVQRIDMVADVDETVGTVV